MMMSDTPHPSFDLPVIHLTDLVGRGSGGLGPLSLAMAAGQRALGCDARLHCLDTASEVADAAAAAGLQGYVRHHDALVPPTVAFSPDLIRWAGSADAGQAGVLHQHGIWTMLSLATVRWRRRWKRPTVVAPQGTLAPALLKHSRVKKQLALATYEGSNLRNASCLQATADLEARTFRDRGLRNPIAVIPNAIPDDWTQNEGDAERFRSAFDLPRGRRLMLFLSRVHPQKGLPLLLDAMAAAGAALEGWDLVIVGPDEEGHRAELEGQAERLGLQKRIHFTGPAWGQSKVDAFAAADLFALPTYSDCFALAVAEALGMGVPVITTHGAPWALLEQHGCGWWTPVSSDGLETALRKAAALPAPELAAMGARGRDLVEQRFTRSTVAAQSLELYAWLHGRAARPDFVITD